jgi:hypothetical protein
VSTPRLLTRSIPSLGWSRQNINNNEDEGQMMNQKLEMKKWLD